MHDMCGLPQSSHPDQVQHREEALMLHQWCSLVLPTVTLCAECTAQCSVHSTLSPDVLYDAGLKEGEFYDG